MATPPVYNRGGVTIRPAVWLDVEQMAGRLREVDQEEIRASTGLDPGNGLRRSFYASAPECYTLLHSRVPVAMGGVTPQGSIWLLATDEIDEIKQGFHRIAQAYIQYFLETHEMLYNMIDVRNTKTRKWLSRCGAKFTNIVLTGPKKMKFECFEFTRGS